MTRRTVKYRIRQIVRRTGWDVVRFQGDFEILQARLLDEEAIDCLVDVGANEGQYAQRIRQLGFAGPIVAFEPLATSYERLLSNFRDDASFRAERIAAGSQPGSARLNVSGNEVSSSLLPMAPAHQRADPHSAYTRVEDVRVTTLDSVAIEGQRVWLKIDVQGTEDKVLEGAIRLLSRVRVVQLELSLVELYDGAPLAESLISRLRQAGFSPVHLAPGFADERTGETLQVDALFRANDPSDSPC